MEAVVRSIVSDLGINVATKKLVCLKFCQQFGQSALSLPQKQQIHQILECIVDEIVIATNPKPHHLEVRVKEEVETRDQEEDTGTRTNVDAAYDQENYIREIWEIEFDQNERVTDINQVNEPDKDNCISLSLSENRYCDVEFSLNGERKTIQRGDNLAHIEGNKNWTTKKRLSIDRKKPQRTSSNRNSLGEQNENNDGDQSKISRFNSSSKVLSHVKRLATKDVIDAIMDSDNNADLSSDTEVSLLCVTPEKRLKNKNVGESPLVTPNQSNRKRCVFYYNDNSDTDEVESDGHSLKTSDARRDCDSEKHLECMYDEEDSGSELSRVRVAMGVVKGSKIDDNSKDVSCSDFEPESDGGRKSVSKKNRLVEKNNILESESKDKKVKKKRDVKRTILESESEEEKCDTRDRKRIKCKKNVLESESEDNDEKSTQNVKMLKSDEMKMKSKQKRKVLESGSDLDDKKVIRKKSGNKKDVFEMEVDDKDGDRTKKKSKHKSDVVQLESNDDKGRKYNKKKNKNKEKVLELNSDGEGSKRNKRKSKNKKEVLDLDSNDEGDKIKKKSMNEKELFKLKWDDEEKDDNEKMTKDNNRMVWDSDSAHNDNEDDDIDNNQKRMICNDSEESRWCEVVLVDCCHKASSRGEDENTSCERKSKGINKVDSDDSCRERKSSHSSSRSLSSSNDSSDVESSSFKSKRVEAAKLQQSLSSPKLASTKSQSISSQRKREKWPGKVDELKKKSPLPVPVPDNQLQKERHRSSSLKSSLSSLSNCSDVESTSCYEREPSPQTQSVLSSSKSPVTTPGAKSKLQTGVKRKRKENQDKNSVADKKPESKALKSLRAICRHIGFVLRNTIELEGCDTSPQKVDRIKSLLREKGMKGKPSMKAAEQYNLERELKELGGVYSDSDSPSPVQGRRKRQKKSNFSANIHTTPVAPKDHFSHLKDIFSADDSSD